VVLCQDTDINSNFELISLPMLFIGIQQAQCKGWVAGQKTTEDRSRENRSIGVLSRRIAAKQKP
jgi:hypothetical protein